MKAKNSIIITITLISALLLTACSPATQKETKTIQNKTTSTQKETKNILLNNKYIPLTNNMQTQLEKPKKGDKIAIIQTDEGTIKIKLFTEQAPETTTNFIKLTEQGKYINVPFHRVVKNFVIQSGDFENKNGTGGYSYKGKGTTINDEVVSTLHHLYGAVAMAKTIAPNSAGSQFYIVTAETGTPMLDGNYSVFGQVYEGIEVAKKIESYEIDNTQKPSKTINIKSITIKTQE